MQIERTFDQEFIIRCVTEPSHWRASVDDGVCNPDLYFPPMHDSIFWLKVGEYGVFMLHPHNLITYEVHTILLPHTRGKAVDVAIEARNWFFTNTQCERIITNVPSFNQLALRLAKKSGMTEYGINPKSFKKGGVLYDQTLLGISKGEISWQQ